MILLCLCTQWAPNGHPIGTQLAVQRTAPQRSAAGALRQLSGARGGQVAVVESSGVRTLVPLTAVEHGTPRCVRGRSNAAHRIVGTRAERTCPRRRVVHRATHARS